MEETVDRGTEKITISGYVDHYIFRNEANGYGVAVVYTKDGELTMVGNCKDLDEGESFEAEGMWVMDQSYGKQFKLSQFHVIPPQDKESIERYLGSGAVKGVGPKMAATIVKEFGEDTLRIIEEEPERLAEIRGISMKKAMNIAIQIEEKRDLRDAMMYLGKFHISQNLAVKIFETYGIEMYKVMENNPYRLAEDISGVGFQTADRIAQEIGIALNSDFRVRAGILYALLQSTQSGHCYLPMEELFAATVEILGVEQELVERQIGSLALDRKLIIRDEKVYLAMYYHAELGCAKMLHEINLRLEDYSEESSLDNGAVFSSSGNTPSQELETKIKHCADRLRMEVDPLQLDAVKKAVSNGLFILSGGPGTGKTTTINLIIQYFVEQGKDILLAAPTGRAAKRMTEATGYEATTIHRLLEVGGGQEELGQSYFGRDSDNPLEADVIIIDEMSMVDILLFHGLLKAIVPGTRLILVGDVDQLPSVGAGQVLRDLIVSGCYPCVILQKIFRQAMDSDIIVNSHKINRGEEIRLDTKSKDFLFLERADVMLIRETMAWLIKEKLPAYCNADVMDIQVLTPMRKGALGCQELNGYLQGVLNPPAPEKTEHYVGDVIFREGDKVMQIKNNYKLEWEIRGRFNLPIESGVGVFNGDVGIIREIDNSSATMTVEYDDHRMVQYGLNSLEELELAYAITIHKAQGSEYPAVVMPLLEVPRLLSYRNLLYTGITRAKKCVCILGSSNTVRGMIDNEGENKRYTSLSAQIIDWEGL